MPSKNHTGLKKDTKVEYKMRRIRRRRKEGGRVEGRGGRGGREGGEGRRRRRRINLPWFFTPVTYPLVLQSTVSGRVTPLGGRKDDPCCSVLLEK